MVNLLNRDGVIRKLRKLHNSGNRQSISTAAIEHDVLTVLEHKIDPVFRHEPIGLKSGQSGAELWNDISQLAWEVEWLVKYLADNRLIVVLPEDNLPEHFCIVYRYHEEISPKKVTQWKARRNARKIPSEDYLRWKSVDDVDPSVNRFTKSIMILRARLGLLPAHHAGLSNAQASPRSLVVADGSAVSAFRAFGAYAEARYIQMRRWPWGHADNSTVDLSVRDVVGTPSYHCEIKLPFGTQVESATILLRNDDAQEVSSTPPSESEMILVDDDDERLNSVHLHFSPRLSRRKPTMDSFYEPTVRVVLRPTWHNGLRAGSYAMALALFTLLALLFSFGTRSLGHAFDIPLVSLGLPFIDLHSLSFNFPWWDVPLVGNHSWTEVKRNLQIPMGKEGDGNADAVVALLVLAPSIGLSWVARQDEHHLTKAVHDRFRKRLHISAISTFIAAFVIALGSSDDYVFWVLLACSAVVLCCFGRTLRSGLYSRKKVT